MKPFLLPKVIFRRKIMCSRQPRTLHKHGVPAIRTVLEHGYGSTKPIYSCLLVSSSKRVEILNNHIRFRQCKNKNTKCSKRCGDRQGRHLWKSGISLKNTWTVGKEYSRQKRVGKRQHAAQGEPRGGPYGREQRADEREAGGSLKRKLEDKCAGTCRSARIFIVYSKWTRKSWYQVFGRGMPCSDIDELSGRSSRRGREASARFTA